MQEELGLVPSLEDENELPNVFDIEKAFTQIGKSGLANSLTNILATKIGSDPRVDAEYEAFYEKSEMLRMVAKRHSWTRATISAVARAAVGAGFSFVRHPVYGRNLKIRSDEAFDQLMPVYDFFYGVNDNSKFIQDLYTLPAKIYYSIASLVYYGQSAWEIIYDDNGVPISFDVLPGIVKPNVNERGRFMRPAWYFRPWNSKAIVEYRNPKEIMYVMWPGIDYSIFGATEYDSLAEISIPSDLYASTSYRNHFENINSPYNGVWVVDKETREEDYKIFLSTLVNRYSGVANYGRTPMVIRGDVEFKETRSRSNDDAPYLQGRQYNQEEISAVTGVSSAKMGLASNTTKTNFRDQRRDFHENTLRPVFQMMEHAIHHQIFVRGFGIKEWMIQFNSPDLTTSLEAATINTRYIQNGVLNINEVRETLGYPQRDDEMGRVFFVPNNLIQSDQIMTDNQEKIPGTGEEQHANNPEGSSDRQFDQVRPSTQDRAHTGFEALPSDKAVGSKDDVIEELRTWKRFATRVADGKRMDRNFIPKAIPQESAVYIEKTISEMGNDKTSIQNFFNSVISDVLDVYNPINVTE